MQSVKEALQLITAQQQRTQSQIDQLTRSQQQANATVDRLGQRVDSVVFEFQRVLSNHGGQIERTETAVESLANSVGRLTRRRSG